MEDFPWTCDQFQRYSVLKEFLEIFSEGKKIRVLDVGGLSPDRKGKGLWQPIQQIYSGASFCLDIIYFKGKNYVQGDGKHLPFKKESFDVVAALDVIEHLQPEDRERFLEEVCRVSGGSVVISAPFQDEDIQQAENLLFEQVKKLHDVEHQQLLEHRRNGLPEKIFISQTLEKYMSSGVDFSYGSLKNWVALQSLKNCFMFKRNSENIHSLLDKWMTGACLESEFDPPFSRHFWLYSKNIPQQELEQRIEVLKRNLTQNSRVEFHSQELFLLNREIVGFFSRENVSALVVSSGEKKNLVSCLNHLLTQKVDFNLEVNVWNIGKDTAIEEMVRVQFPGVEYFSSEIKEKFPNALLKVTAEQKGDLILLLSEDILLPSDSVKSFYDQLQSSPEGSLLVPRIVWKKYFSAVWAGRKLSFRKLLSGRGLNTVGRIRVDSARWVFSECLFFRKQGLNERVLKTRSLKKRNIFLWERTKTGKKFIYLAETPVYKSSA